MHGNEENGFIALKLDSGEDFYQALNKAIDEFEIESGYILTGIGMLRDVEIGYFDGEKYLNQHLEKPHELVSMQGSISTIGETIIHIHCSLAGPDHRIVGGHLNRGTVNVINEILIKRLDDIKLRRKLNPDTGLKELFIE